MVMTRRPARADDPAMKILLASVSWFAAAWFVYDATAFLLGAPRHVTPLVALVVALGVGLALHARAISRPSFGIASDADVRGVG
jgi:hypothetical protein